MEITKSKKVYTNTNTHSQTEIITDIPVNTSEIAPTQPLSVKVDPGAEANCMPLRQFISNFPQLCENNGKPGDGILEQSLALFGMCGGETATVLGHFQVAACNIQQRSWLPIRFHVKDRRDMKCTNSAERNKHLVHTVTRSACGTKLSTTSELTSICNSTRDNDIQAGPSFHVKLAKPAVRLVLKDQVSSITTIMKKRKQKGLQKPAVQEDEMASTSTSQQAAHPATDFKAQGARPKEPKLKKSTIKQVTNTNSIRTAVTGPERTELLSGQSKVLLKGPCNHT